MRKFWTVLGFAIACLVAAVAWELVFYEVARDDDGSKFQRRLQQEEEKVDLLLEDVTPRNVNFTFPWNHKGTVLMVYDDGELAYWSNERVGARGLYHRLKSGGCFQKINNVYYDIRLRRDGDREYFALIMVREDYPFTNEYIRNHFNPALEVDVDNVEKLTVRGKDERVGNLIRNRDGEPLFRLENTLSRVDYQPNNLILVLYLAFFFLLLYAYGIRLERCGGWFWNGLPYGTIVLRAEKRDYLGEVLFENITAIDNVNAGITVIWGEKTCRKLPSGMSYLTASAGAAWRSSATPAVKSSWTTCGF